MAKRKPTVLIIGGGVAGLSAAHELIERGFAVTVLEKRIIPGGKARSIPVYESLRGVESRSELPRGFGPKPWVPGEHGFRFFPGFYKHIIDTMSRIPTADGGTVEDRLVDTTRITITQFGKPWVSMPARFPRTPHDLQAILQTLVQAFGPELAINPDELAYFVQRLWQIMTSCRERRDEQYEKTAWWDFIGAEERSKAYQDLLGSAITRSLVAAKARTASTKTIGDIFVQLLLTILQPHLTSSDRVLDGPTNLAWINPWVDFLGAQGVEYKRGYTVTELACDGQRITGVQALDFDNNPTTFKADHYLLSIPVERVPKLLSSAILTADPSLAKIIPLAENVEWMNGLQYYLKKDVPIEHGHGIHLDSPWALTTISQAQFWPDINLAEWGDRDSRGVLSVDVSDWDAIGLNGKRARDCTRAEIGAEVWRQLKLSLNGDGRQLLTDDNLHSWHLDPDIQPDPNKPGEMLNMEPLLVNLIDTWKLRPEATTGIPNLFLASDYVRTYTDLATMEGANEAARRAVNGILQRSGSAAEPCTLWPHEEPAELAPFWEHDRARYDAGLPWDGQLSTIGVEAVTAAQRSGALLPALRAMQAPLGITLIPHDIATRGPQAIEGLTRHTGTDGEPADTELDFEALEAPDATDLMQRGLIPPHSPEADAHLGDDWSDDMQRADGSAGERLEDGHPDLVRPHAGPSTAERTLGSAIPGYDLVFGSDGVVGKAIITAASTASQSLGGDLPAGSGGMPSFNPPTGMLGLSEVLNMIPQAGGLPGGNTAAPADVTGLAMLPSGVPDLWEMALKDGARPSAMPAAAGLPNPTFAQPPLDPPLDPTLDPPLEPAPAFEPTNLGRFLEPSASVSESPAHAARTAVSALPEPMATAPMLARLGTYRAQVGEYLNDAIPTREPQRYLYGLIREFVERGGKGLRPGIAMATAEAFGAPATNAMPSAAGLELLHNAFLVHDDIQDESEFRRSLPTAHRAIGVPLAINLGDAMQALSMQLFRRNLDTLGPVNGARVLQEVERMNLETLEGQALELGWIRDRRHDVTADDYLEMVLKKTAWYTFSYPMRLGALAANPAIDPSRFDQLGFLLGAAFQIQDDVLNLVADERYGKEIGGDLYEGKRTLVLVDLLDHASPLDARWIADFLNRPRKRRLPREVYRLRALIDQYGSLERTQAIAEHLASLAEQELESVFADAPNQDAVSFLRGLARYTIRRDL